MEVEGGRCETWVRRGKSRTSEGGRGVKGAMSVVYEGEV